MKIQFFYDDSVDDINETTFNSYLDTDGLPYPDLIIRTSGEHRLSGMMPFQGVYAELAFVDLLFPDFNKQAFNNVIDEFLRRDRRFGGK